MDGLMRLMKLWVTGLFLITGMSMTLFGCGSDDTSNSTMDQQPRIAVSPSPSPSPSSSSTPTFSEINQTIIQTSCISCHSGSSPSGGINYSTYAGVLTEVTPGNPSTSPFYTSVANGNMPPEGPALSSAEIQEIYDWIAAGAPND